MLKKISKHIGFRLALWHSLFILLVMTVVCSYIYVSAKHILYKELKQYIHHELTELSELISDTGLDNRIKEIIRDELSINSDYDHRFAVFKNNLAQPVFSNLTVLDSGCETLLDEIRSSDGYRRTFELNQKAKKRYLAVQRSRHENDIFYLLIGTDTEIIHKDLLALRNNIFLMLPVLFALSILLGWAVSFIFMRPVRNLRRVVEEITLKNLNHHVRLRGSGDDFDKLSSSFNRMTKQLNDSYQQISRFTSDVSHELNTPLTVMKNELEIALSKERTAAEYKKILRSQSEELERLSQLVQSMLWLAKADHYSLQIRKEKLNLKGLIEDVFETYEPLAELKSVTLHMNVDGGITIWADRPQINQLFANLIDNAVKFNRDSGTVEVTARTTKDTVTVTIRDEGCGIADSDYDRIFERFFRSSDHSSVAGYGLGLSIVSAIAKMHSATVHIAESSPKGSSIEITFPL